MRFKFCPDCGAKAVQREIGDEGLMPYCESCEKPLFDMFPACVLCAAVNEENKILLIRQSYGDTDKNVGVAGYIKSGETAETAARREVTEETGLDVTGVSFVKSMWFSKKEMLMLGFLVRVSGSDFKLSGEVKSAVWYSPGEAAGAVNSGSKIQELIIAADEIIKQEMGQA